MQVSAGMELLNNEEQERDGIYIYRSCCTHGEKFEAPYQTEANEYNAADILNMVPRCSTGILNVFYVNIYLM